MNELQLYEEIGKWINRFHRRDWFYTGLLKDFQHDLWERMRSKTVNTSYIKQRCYHYPLSAIRHLYYKRDRDFVPRERVVIDNEGNLAEFPDYSMMPDFEFQVVKEKKVSKYRKNHKPRNVIVTYVNGETEVFESTRALAEFTGTTITTIQRKMGKTLAGRYTNRKLSHIKLIMQEVKNPFSGNRAKPIKQISRKTYDSNPDKYGDYIYDPERQWSDFNETVALLVHKEREEYILVKEKSD